MRRLQRFLPTQFAREFLALESAGGIVMIAAAAIAIALANSPLSALYHQLITAPLALGMNVSHFTKDVLMAIFFFTVGMELKCEMREGALASPGQKILPLVAALGGIILPATLYLAITAAHPEYRAGWAIPTATDIAFALCVLRLVGPRVPNAAKIFLLAIAIYDDLAAILIIAFFYAAAPSPDALAIVAVLCTTLYGLNRAHITHFLPYLILGSLLWLAVHHAGIHPTVAGVLTALAIPMRSRTTKPVLAPLLHKLHPYVAFAILPLFAFTSAGVDLRGLSPATAFSALPIAIILALFFGKQLGIFLTTFISVRLKLAPLPEGVNWGEIYGISILAGIGFTMSLFIGQLAFSTPEIQDFVKLGVLAGSLISAIIGFIYLRTRRNS